MSPTALRQARRKPLENEGQPKTDEAVGAHRRGSVLIIGPSAPPYNGMTRAIELTLAALEEDLSIVHLDTADRRGLSNMGRFEPGNLVLAAKHGLTFLWLLLTKRPRIVYVPISQAWLPFLRDCLFLIPARVLRRKTVIHLHGGHFGRFYREASPLMRLAIRYAIGRTSCAIVLGKNVASAFDGILPRERVRIIPNGIPDDFAGRAPAKSKDPGSHLLYLGTLASEKGFLDLLRALPKVRERHGAVSAVFAGEWFSEQDRESAMDIIKSQGLGGIVKFVGPVGPERKKRLLEEANVFIFPTAYRYEGHPYVVLEAMAAGLPVISTNVACIPETIRDGVEGFLIEPGDIETLADRIGCLLGDEPLRSRMGKAGRQRFLDQYTYEKFAEGMKAVFAEVLQPPNSSGYALHQQEELTGQAAHQP